MYGQMLMGGMGLMQMFAGREKAAAQAAMEQAQHRIKLANYNREQMQNTLQNMLKNEEISRINQARWRQNRAIAKAANETRALREDMLSKNTASKLINISRGSTQSLDSLLSSTVGAGLSPQSGTASALRRQLEENGHKEMMFLKDNDYYQRQNIIREQENALRKRDLHSWNAGSYYMPGPAPQLVQQTGTSALQDMSAFMGGAASATQMMGGINQAMPAGQGVNWFG